MSLKEVLRTEAVRAFNSKNWAQACVRFDNYFKKVYPDEGVEMSEEDTTLLLQYAEALFEKVKQEAVNNKYDLEELDNVASYALAVKNSLKAVDAKIRDRELLGEVARINNQFEQSEREYLDAYKIACEENQSWRIRLSLLYNVAIAQEAREKPVDAMESIKECIKISDEELAKNPSAEDVELINDFKKEFEEKTKHLQEDAKEQEDNKDIIKDEDDNNEEDDQNEEEEEEEEAADEE